MIKNSYIVSLLLVLLAVIFFLLTGEKTALSPLGPGIPIALCAWLAQSKPNTHKHAMHVAMVFALLGILAPLYPIVSDLSQGQLTLSAIESLIMLVLCGVYLGLGVKSFIDARRAAEQ